MLQAAEFEPPATMEAVTTTQPQLPSRKAAVVLSFFVFVLAAATSACAHIVDFDESWQARAKEARAHALHAFHPDPDTVTEEANHRVNK